MSKGIRSFVLFLLFCATFASVSCGLIGQYMVTVTVYDESKNKLEGATVTMTYSMNGGSEEETVSVTDNKGQVMFNIEGKMNANIMASVSVEKDGYAAKNDEKLNFTGGIASKKIILVSE